ncbi:sensor histidine kinase [Myxacorys almedinensis]|uniref:Circadian input-output histidine kinase CikA n=1 Tax=Myxacorys almedinensis A TaxID=2690445 RepID=A0A8J8CKU8_9CYAN|nr:ATP-binding protein [Myxacorys almedinensis]NDJ18966.1 PAS domain-containing protein [Myxacorys almedinensis A]
MTQQFTVLTVDSSRENQQIYRRFLLDDLEQDYSIYEAVSAQDGLAHCQHMLPDVVLLNVSLPDQNGLQFLADLKAQCGVDLPPIIVVASHGDESLAVKAIKAGAQNYLALESMTPEQLRLAMLSALQVGHLRQQFSHSQFALKSTEDRLRLALESAHVGAWEWNLKSGELSWSENVAAVLGLSPEAFTKTFEGWLECIHPSDRDLVVQRFNQAIETRLVQGVVPKESQLSSRYRLVTPSGEVRWLHCKGRVEYDETGQPTRLVGITQDITDRKQIEQRLRQYVRERTQLLKQEQAAREEAEIENHSKDEFLAVVTHELRSPLNAILGWANLLRTRNLDLTASDRALETIERNAKAQSRLIEDLLDVSRIIRGKLHLARVVVNLHSTIETAVDAVRFSAEQKQIQIAAISAPQNSDKTAPSPVRVAGDPSRLQQVVLNLLTNAVKFTPNGGQVTVDVSALTEESMAQIMVSDTGIGISPKFLPHVFDRFRQSEDAEVGMGKGLGLGLAIVHQLVELHGGTVQVKSDGEGKGTTFTVKLPLVSAQ